MSRVSFRRARRATGRLKSSYYYFSGDSALSTNGGLGFGTLRLRRLVLPHPVTIDRLGGECSVAGSAGTLLLPAIFSDVDGQPSSLLLAPGNLDGTLTTAQELTVSLTLPAGPTWWGGVLQGTGTQPTVRTIGAPDQSDLFPASISGAPAAGTSPQSCYTMTGVTAAIPSTFTINGIGGSAPRLFFRVA